MVSRERFEEYQADYEGDKGRKPSKSSVRIASNVNEIQTRYLANTIADTYWYPQPATFSFWI